MNMADHLHPRDGEPALTEGASVNSTAATPETAPNASVPTAPDARPMASGAARAASRGWLIALPAIAIAHGGIAYAVPLAQPGAEDYSHRLELARPAATIAAPVAFDGAAHDAYGLSSHGLPAHFAPRGYDEVQAAARALTPSALTRSRTFAARRTVALPEGPVRRRSTRATEPFALERMLVGAQTVEVASIPKAAPSLNTRALARVTPGAVPTAVSDSATPTKHAGGTTTRPAATSAAKATAKPASLQPISVKALAPVSLPALSKMPLTGPAVLAAGSGKSVLPGSKFELSRIETAALRVMRPSGTQWLQFTGARSTKNGALSVPMSAPDLAALPIGAVPLGGALKALPPTPALSEADATRGMRKVVSALAVPPSSQPLPSWMQAKAVTVDSLAAPGAVAPVRSAQNPDAAPLRPARPVTNSDRLPNQLEVSTGTFVVLLTTSDLSTVAVADPSVADVAIVNSRSVLVNGKTPGVTSLVIVDKNRIRQYQVRVSPGQGTRPADVAAAIGLPGVGVRPLRDALVLEGEVDSVEEERRALEIAGVFAPKVINQLTVRGAAGSEAALATQIQNAINLPNVTVRTINDTIVLDGSVENAAQRQRAENVANALGKKTLNLITLPTLSLDQVRDSIGALPANAPADANGIHIRQAGDQIVLEGFVQNQAFMDQALATAGRSGLQVINRLLLTPAIPTEVALLSTITNAINIPGVRAFGTAKRLVLQGQVADTNQAVLAEQIARGYAPEVDNLLVTPNPINVNVDVALVEINKNDLRNLGATFTSFLDGAANPVGFVLSEPTSGGVPGLVTANAGTNSTGVETRTRSPLQASLRAVIDNGRARLLSNPNTTVLSGRTATFQVGGQVPIPGSTTVTNSGSTTAIIFKDFGVLIDVVPSARPDGVVTMRVRTEVSQPDFTLGVTPPGGGSAIPGFQRRSAVTEVTVKPGGTIALAGMIQNNVQQLKRRLPLLSNIPVLGALFTSKRFQNDETELAIFVTPHVLPNPLKPGEVAPAAPIPVGNTINVGTTTGNPGIASFNTGGIFTSPGSGSAGGQ